ncbi:hypothetical protein JXB41_08030 [Candidatus Woesearchaeota archaeon]|nr:hypothetical protein [Candidatus Woesearchaeota archaeon]
MRQIIISDTHTNDNIEFILSYIKKLILRVKIDNIVINGDILGINEIKKDYGYKFNKNEFYDSLNKEALLKKIAPGSSEKIIEIISHYKRGELIDDSKREELGRAICNYIEERYNYIIEILKRFSSVKKTFFNLGNYESPLHYLVLKELSFLLDVGTDMIRKSILYTPYRDIYKSFKEKLKSLEGKNFKYIGGMAVMEKGFIFAGIPGLNPSSVPTESASELQEKITKELTNSIKRHFSYSNKLIIYNHAEGRITKEPFTFRPGSASVRSFIQETKGKLRQKIFVQSHYHWVTTHFYTRDDFYYLLNNAGVNNCLFNIIDISNKIRCFDVDPSINKIRELKLYDSYIADYSNAEERLALNYNKPKEITEQRNLKGCYYM